MHGAEGRAGDRALGVGCQAGDPEVGDHRPAVAREQDVARLDIAVDDASDVRHAERTGDVEADACCLRRGEATDTTQPGGQVLALDELHDQERLAIVGAGLEAGDDVRVAQDGLRQCLAPEAHRDVGIGDHLAPQQLDRDGTVGFGVDRAVDRGHATDPDDLGQPIPAADKPTLVRRGRRGLDRVRHEPTIAEVPETGRRRPGSGGRRRSAPPPG